MNAFLKSKAGEKMLIGIISDTHDNMDAISDAVRLLNSRGVKLVVHAGDIISPFAAAGLKGLNCPVKAVFGNNDGERSVLKARFKEYGTSIDDFIEFDAGGKRFAVYHGTIQGVLTSIVNGGQYDCVISGHAHKYGVLPTGNTLHINPGEACGYLSKNRTLCILDTGTMEPELLSF